MKERLLQYIWQFQHYNKNELTTTAGEPLAIIHQGNFNHHQGPDFLQARIRIGRAEWAGNIELHVNSSDWKKHKHDGDVNYGNVVLHVVWNDDQQPDESKIPTLVLENRIPKVLLHRYEKLLIVNDFIPCSSMLKDTDDMIWAAWKERLLIERLQRKSEYLMGLLSSVHYHWEEVLWWVTARTFGLTVNAEAFLHMARTIPYALLLKCKNHVFQLEALIMGQAGLLNREYSDAYANALGNEYAFLRSKYDLNACSVPVHYLRMRPRCFPTVRLAQLSALMHKVPHLMSVVLSTDEPQQLMKLLDVKAGDYWDDRYRFDEPAVHEPKYIGKQMAANVMVNAIIPVLFAYGEYRLEHVFKSKAVEWMSRLAGEKNAVTTRFKSYGVTNQDAAASQALLELKTMYCDERRCLDCAIGHKLLKRHRVDERCRS